MPRARFASVSAASRCSIWSSNLNRSSRRVGSSSASRGGRATQGGDGFVHPGLFVGVHLAADRGSDLGWHVGGVDQPGGGVVGVGFIIEDSTLIVAVSLSIGQVVAERLDER